MSAAHQSGLQLACDAIRNINFRLDDRDKACETFENFRKAINRASGGATRYCDIDCLEPKAQIYQFLVDFSERYAKYRARVAEVFKALKKSEPWLAVIEGRPENIEAFRQVASVDNGRTTKELRDAAAAAAFWGDIGVLSLRVGAAYNLPMGSSHHRTHDASSTLRVCINVGGRAAQTSDVPRSSQPNWNSDEFVFEIGSTDWRIKLEIIAKSYAGTSHVGSLSVPLEEVVKHSGILRLRRCLDDLPNSELQLALQYVSASGSTSEQQAQTSKAAVLGQQQAAATAKVRPTIDLSQLWSVPCHTPRASASNNSNSDKSRTESNPFKLGASSAPTTPTRATRRASLATGRSRASANPFITDLSPASLTPQASSANPFKNANCRSRGSSNPFKLTKAENSASRSDESSPKRFEYLWSPRIVCAW
jgi:hypothetical protein